MKIGDKYIHWPSGARGEIAGWGPREVDMKVHGRLQPGDLGVPYNLLAHDWKHIEEPSRCADGCPNGDALTVACGSCALAVPTPGDSRRILISGLRGLIDRGILPAHFRQDLEDRCIAFFGVDFQKEQK